MTKKKNPLSRIRLVYQQSSPLLKCVVLSAIVICTLCLLLLRGEITKVNANTETKRHEAAQLEHENAKLERYIAELGTVQGVKRIAREELGLVAPDTIFYIPADSVGE